MDGCVGCSSIGKIVTSPGASFVSASSALGASTSHPSPSRRATSISDDDQSSTESDQDDSSYTTEEPASPAKASVKLAPFEDDIVSQAVSLRDVDQSEEAEYQLALEIPRLYIEALDDVGIPIAVQRQMQKEFPGPVAVVSLPASHAPYYSMPERLAEAIADFADAPAEYRQTATAA